MADDDLNTFNNNGYLLMHDSHVDIFLAKLRKVGLDYQTEEGIEMFSTFTTQNLRIRSLLHSKLDYCSWAGLLFVSARPGQIFCFFEYSSKLFAIHVVLCQKGTKLKFYKRSHIKQLKLDMNKAGWYDARAEDVAEYEAEEVEFVDGGLFVCHQNLCFTLECGFTVMLPFVSRPEVDQWPKLKFLNPSDLAASFDKMKTEKIGVNIDTPGTSTEEAPLNTV